MAAVVKAAVGALLMAWGTAVMSVPDRTVEAAGAASAPVRTLADSTSVILRSTHILVLEILSVDGEDWTPGPRGTSTRAIRIEARLAALIKGRLDVTSGEGLRISAHISRSGPRAVGLPGVWSRHPPQPGQRIAVFSSAQATHADAVMAEPSLLRILPAAEVDADLRQAKAIEEAGAPLVAALGRVSEPPLLTPLFAEYLVACLDQEHLIAAPKDLAGLLQWLEAEGRSPAVRLFVIPALYQRMLSGARTPRASAVALARSSLRLLADAPADDALAQRLVETDLPHLLGLEGSAPKLTPETLFASAPGERDRARRTLREWPAGRARDRLVAWIGS